MIRVVVGRNIAAIEPPFISEDSQRGRCKEEQEMLYRRRHY